MRQLICALAVTVFATAPSEVRAQRDNDPTTDTQTIDRSPDFLFGRPSVTVGVRGLWRQSSGDSEIFDFVQDELTLEKNDFNAPGIFLDLAFPVTGRLDALFGFEFSRSSALSEVRDFVEDNDLPIEQITDFTQVNLTGSVEFALLPRGREIGRYAWIPSRIVPYVGAGGGFLWYEFLQEGDFVDTINCDDFGCPIFSARLVSSGWTPSAHVAGGVDVRLTNRLYASGEVRYQWAQTEMSRDFIGFDDIDLSGLRIMGGIQYSF